jgi:hypothetical protein
MTRPAGTHSRETQEISRALRRAARRALELGLQTGTPVYVIKNNKIVDLTKQKSGAGRQKRANKSPSNRSSR